MKTRAIPALFAVLSSLLPAQDPQPPAMDRVVLTNGDQLTGAVKTLAGGELILTSPLLGEVTIPLEAIADLQTASPVELLTTGGETLIRRITGIQDGALLLAAAPGLAPAAPSLPLDQLDQINPLPTPKAAWTGAFNFGGVVSGGNTDLRGASLSFDAERRGEIDRVTFKGSWNYQEDKQGGAWNLTQRRVGGSLQYDYFLTGEKAYLLASAAAEGDTFQDIQLRFTSGAGYGYQWAESDEIKFGTEAALNYYSQEFRSATPSDQYLALRLGYNLDWSIIPDLKFLQSLDYLPSLEGTDYFAHSDARLRLTMTDNLFAQFQWVFEYNSSPSPGFQSADNRYLLSIGWSF